MSQTTRICKRKSNTQYLTMRQVEEILNDFPSLLAEISDLWMIYHATEPRRGTSIVKFSQSRRARRVKSDPTQAWGIKRAEIKTLLDEYEQLRKAILKARAAMTVQERMYFDLYFGERTSKYLVRRIMGITAARFRELKYSVILKVWKSCRKSAIKAFKS